MTNQTVNQSSTSDERPRMGIGPRGGGGGPNRFRTIEKAQNPNRALRRLVDYLKPFKIGITLVLVLVLVYTLLGLLGPYLMGRAIDKFIDGKDPIGLGRLALLMLVTYFLFNAFQAAANWVMARVSQHALKNVRHDLFEHLQ
jgi:ATP-binding cassette subfamily B multidrug efflux pump